MKKIILIIICLALMYDQTNAQSLNNRVIIQSECGLNFIQKPIKITSRHAPGGNAQPVTLNVSELPGSCVNIVAAYVWWVVSYSPSTTANPVLSITNPLNQNFNITPALTGELGSKCWDAPRPGHINEIGTRGYRATVTNAITGNGNYVINTGTPDIETDGLTLMIIYQDLKANYEGHIVINDGFITIDNGGDVSQTLSGFNACGNSIAANAMMIASDLQSSVASTVDLTMNGTVINYPRTFWNSEVSNTTVTQNQTTSSFGIEGRNDCYSWIMMGLYYQTNTCKTCPDRLNINATKNPAEICLGGSVNLDATGGVNYSWTSNPPGFTSNQKSPTVSPTVTTTYTVVGTDANNCLTGTASVTVPVNPLPIINVGSNIRTCLGTPVTIGNNATNGTPPFTYQWSPAAGLSSTTTAIVQANPTTTTTYTVRVTDSKGCQATDNITVTVLPLPNPIITPSGPTTFCSCDSVILDAGNLGYVSYLWSTNETTRTIKVRNSGNYTVQVTDTNGCRNTSPPITITVVQPTTTVATTDTVITVKTGQIFNVPLRIVSASDLDFCKAFNYTTLISFNKKIIVPYGNTPKGTISGDTRTLTLKGTRNGSEPILQTLTFIATLGDVEEAPLTIETFVWDECPFNVTRIDSTVRLINLCKEGGITRFYRSSSGTLALEVKPNPIEYSADIEYKLVESGFVKLYLTDILGRKIDLYQENDPEIGIHNKKIDFINIAPGMYNLVLQTPTNLVNILIEVSR